MHERNMHARDHGPSESSGLLSAQACKFPWTRAIATSAGVSLCMQCMQVLTCCDTLNILASAPAIAFPRTQVYEM